jgi:type VI secretion system protein ImpB
MSKSAQHKLDKNRKPRVHITYDVEVGGAKRERELPFVIGVMANLSGKPAAPLPRLSDRTFTEINSENFDKILAGVAPRVKLTVEDKVEGRGPVDIEVNFGRMADFEPDRLVENMSLGFEPLRKLVDERRRLFALLNGMESTPRFGDALQEILNDQSRREQLRGEVDRAAADAGGD